MTKLFSVICLILAHNIYAQVGIGTIKPTAKLHVNGSLRLQNLNGDKHLSN